MPAHYVQLSVSHSIRPEMRTDQCGCSQTFATSIAVIVAMTTVLSWAQLMDHQPVCVCVGLTAHSLYVSCRIVDDSSLLSMMAKNNTMEKFLAVVSLDYCKQGEGLRKTEEN